jgi:hypothetical protein
VTGSGGLSGGTFRFVTAAGNRLAGMENEMVKRLVWSGLLAGCGALASIAANRLASTLWRHLFDEEPPE